MKKYEYGRIARLGVELEKAGIAPGIIGRIMEGGDAIRRGTPPEQKAEWMREAMSRMDEHLAEKTRYAVREACACCLRGKRLETVRQISSRGGTLEDRIKAANEARFVFGHSVAMQEDDEARFVFGHSVAMQEDGRVLVRFSPEGLPGYRCVCLPKAKEPLSITYCYCCGGHVKHHLQIALGRKLVCEVRSSALSSGGKQLCSFLFTLLE